MRSLLRNIGFYVGSGFLVLAGIRLGAYIYSTFGDWVGLMYTIVVIGSVCGFVSWHTEQLADRSENDGHK